MLRFSSYSILHVTKTTNGQCAPYKDGDRKNPGFLDDFWTIYGYYGCTKHPLSIAIGDHKTEQDALDVLYRICGVHGILGKSEYKITDEAGKTLLKIATTTQTSFWKALSALEHYLGFEIDSEQDLQETDIEKLVEIGGPPV